MARHPIELVGKWIRERRQVSPVEERPRGSEDRDHATCTRDRGRHVARIDRDDLGDDVDYILDGGPCAVGVESTIVDFSRGHPVLLRPGGMPRAAIEAIVGPLAVAAAEAPAAPGTLASHYAPRAEVIAVDPS